jgi:hypothetical protein
MRPCWLIGSAMGKASLSRSWKNLSASSPASLGEYGYLTSIATSCNGADGYTSNSTSDITNPSSN